MGRTQETSKKKDRERIIQSGDRLTIETTDQFVEQIRQGLNEAETVVIEFAPDVELDITALQIFCSSCQAASALGKRFMYREPIPAALLNLISAAGAERRDKCVHDNVWCFRKYEGDEKCRS